MTTNTKKVIDESMLQYINIEKIFPPVAKLWSKFQQK